MRPTTKAVVLARGLGSRMRRADPTITLDANQAAAADSGIKGMIPIDRPFLDYVIGALADAGFTDVCLVVGPKYDGLRAYYSTPGRTQRVDIHFAVQELPRGTADAVLAAERFADGEHVVALNSDNYYPVHTLRALRELGSAGVAGFERSALLRDSNIDAAKVAQFSILDIDADGMLRHIVEKPGAANVPAFGEDVFVGMNSWSLPPEIYEACRRIVPSPRRELELPSAVQYAIEQLGIRFRVLTFRDGVLDLSSRSDIAAVAERLRGVEIRL
jgi:dTDP-glucose pyrophosphorylase